MLFCSPHAHSPESIHHSFLWYVSHAVGELGMDKICGNSSGDGLNTLAASPHLCTRHDNNKDDTGGQEDDNQASYKTWLPLGWVHLSSY